MSLQIISEYLRETAKIILGGKLEDIVSKNGLTKTVEDGVPHITVPIEIEVYNLLPGHFESHSRNYESKIKGQIKPVVIEKFVKFKSGPHTFYLSRLIEGLSNLHPDLGGSYSEPSKKSGYLISTSGTFEKIFSKEQIKEFLEKINKGISNMNELWK